MLRTFIKKLIPNKGDVFFYLFEDGAKNSFESAKICTEILGTKDEHRLMLLYNDLKVLKQKASNINRSSLEELNNMFITPIDRADIQKLSALLLKLTKRIVKVSTKFRIFSIDQDIYSCLIKNMNILLISTQFLSDAVGALKNGNPKEITLSHDRINELGEKGIEDMKDSAHEIYSGKFDTITILKLQEITRYIDMATETCVSTTDLVMQISVKSI